jgi:hypothetical protein
MGVSTSSYATAGIALRVSGALKPHHHDKVETPSVGIIIIIIIMALQPFVGPWPLFQYLDPIHGR